jgi:hypothetical protein
MQILLVVAASIELKVPRPTLDKDHPLPANPPVPEEDIPGARLFKVVAAPVPEKAIAALVAKVPPANGKYIPAPVAMQPNEEPLQTS